MINSFDMICAEAQKLKHKYGENNPFHICRDMGVAVLYKSMGTGNESCKGFFLAQSRIRSITINADLSQNLKRIICSHELGHAVIHRKCTGIKAFHDFALFDTASIYEYEANIFAAELLLDDEDVLEVLNEDMSFFQAAPELLVPAEILDFKFRTLKWKGYKVIDAPLLAPGDFLKDIEDCNDDYEC